eukprot:Ihof_evm14s90 gene=Ihof_evmTU14s90
MALEISGIVIQVLLLMTSVVVLYWFTNRRIRTNLKGEVALVTGGGSGLGLSLALKLAALGAKVVVWDINEGALRELAHKATAELLDIVTDIVDVSKPEAIRTAAKNVGTVTILVNNAGVVSSRPLEELTETMIERTFKINVIAHFHTVKAFLTHMKANNYGHIVTLASILGYMGVSRLTDYTASKAAAIQFHESLVMELTDWPGVNTTLVCPATIGTSMFEGVTTTFPPILEADYVADKIVQSIL